MREEKTLNEDALAGVTGGHDHAVGGIVGSNNGAVEVIVNNTASSAEGTRPHNGGLAGEECSRPHVNNG